MRKMIPELTTIYRCPSSFVGNSGKKNRNECAHDLIPVVRVLLLETKNLLPQDKAGKHAEEAARCQLRIDRTESSLIYPPLDVVCDGVTRSHARYKHLRELMTFKGTE